MDDITPRSRGRQTGHRPAPPPWRSVPSRAQRAAAQAPRPARSRPIETDVDDFFKPKPAIAKKPQKSRRQAGKRKGIAVLFILLIAAGGAGYWWGIRPQLHSKLAAPASSQPASQTAPPKQLAGNFRVLATGDIITHDTVVQNAKKADGSYDFTPMFSELKPLLESAQTRICHDTVPAAGGALSGYPSFNAPSELMSSLSSSGCNVMSLASDHINDKGQLAIDATMQAVEKEKNIVISSGASRSPDEQARESTFNVGEGAMKFAYFSYTTRMANGAVTPFGVNVYSKDTVRSQIQAAKQKVDIVFVSMCWGKEDSGDIQPEQDQIAQELTDSGADVIFGHCTHVVQPVKRLKSSDDTGRETIVYYSLGNLLNSQLPVETLVGGVAVIDIDLSTKTISSAGLLPTYMHYEWTAAEKAAKSLNARINLKLYPLDKAANALAASQNGTTVEAQVQRIHDIVNRFTPTKVVTSADFNK